MRTACMLVLLYGLAWGAQAQPLLLRGTIADSLARQPLAGVHAFLARTTIGTVTDSAGHFHLVIPEGTRGILCLSLVGYASRRFSLEHLPLPDTIFLAPRILTLPTVIVEDSPPRRWKKHLKRFEKLFLGETATARQTHILNPYVLSFTSTWWGKLEAEAREPLIIENRALGYRIRYFLTSFRHEGTTTWYDGEPLFEPLHPSSPQEARRWEEAREKAYRGSLRHFLRALVADRLEEEGFSILICPTREELQRAHGARFLASRKHLLEPADSAGLYSLHFRGYLEITYWQEPEEEAYPSWTGSFRSPGGTQRSWLKLSCPAVTITATGLVRDGACLTQMGYWAFERFASALPEDYRLPALATR